MILDQCPHCGVKHIQTGRVTAQASAREANDTWSIEVCQNPSCGYFILVISQVGGVIKRVYPGGHHEFDSTVQIPNELRCDFREAGWCLDAGCYKASMVMSRRALQRVLKDQGCDQRNLVDAIDAAMKQSVLRKAFHPLAQEIREYGNLSAHPDDDQLDKVTKEAAQQVMEFVRLIVEEFYEVPGKASLLRKRREIKAQP